MGPLLVSFTVSVPATFKMTYLIFLTHAKINILCSHLQNLHGVFNPTYQSPHVIVRLLDLIFFPPTVLQ